MSVSLTRYNHGLVLRGASSRVREHVLHAFTYSISIAFGVREERCLAIESKSGAVFVPRGFQKELHQLLKTLGVWDRVERVEARDDLPGPDIVNMLSLSKPLRDVQVRSLTELLRFDMGMQLASTSAGKGNMVCALVAAFPSLKVGVFTLSDTLLRDTVSRLKDLAGIDATVVAAGTKGKMGRVTVFSIDTVARAVKAKKPWVSKLAKLQVIIADEVHAFASDTRFPVFRECTGARYRYGMSADVLSRSDGRTPYIVGEFGPVTTTITYEELRDQDLVASANVVFVVFDHVDPAERLTYTARYAANIANNKQRNKLVMRVAAIAQHPAAVFGRRRPQLKLLHKGLSKEFDCTLVHGQVPLAKRVKIASRAAKGDYDILVASSVFFTGVDMPALRSGVSADAGSSAIFAGQKPGRLMRKAEDKDVFVLYDIYDKWPRVAGHPRAFEAQARERLEVYLKKGFNVSFARLVGDVLVPCGDPLDEDDS